MKSISRRITRPLAASLLAALCTAHADAAEVAKADNTDALNLTTSWALGTAPTSADVAFWDSTVTGANTVLLGADTSWQGIKLTTPGGAVTISSGNTLTLGTSGIDLSAATQDLTISSGLTLNGGQIWNVASGRTLTLSTGTFTRNAGTTLNLQGTGTVSAATFPANTNNIVGAWATVGTGTSLSYATKNGSNQLVAFTGTAVNLGSNGNGGGANSATGNFDVTGSAILTGGRSVNTMRFVDTTAMTYNISNRSLLANGLMNAGSATWTISGTTGPITIGATRELALATNTQAFNISAIIADNGLGASGVTFSSPDGGTLTLSGLSTFTGDLNINSGTLLANRANNVLNPANSALGNAQVARNINVNGGTLKFGLGDTLGGAASDVVATLVINQGGTVTNNGNNFTTLGAVNLNGGTLTNTGGATASYQAYNLRGTVTVGGTAASTISGSGTNAGYHLAASTTFNVANVTGNSATDLLISGVLVNQDGTHTGLGSLLKTGLGTLTLSGANTYAGTTTVNSGTLATAATGTFGSGNITVATANLTLGNNTSIGDLATLTFDSGSSTISLNFSGTETLGAVYDSVTSTFLSAGTYDAAQLNTFFGSSNFSGIGSISISAVPEPATYAALAGLAILGFAALRRRRA